MPPKESVERYANVVRDDGVASWEITAEVLLDEVVCREWNADETDL